MPDFPARRAKPRQVFGFTTFEGEQRELRADGGGIVRPQSNEDVAVLVGFGLPVAKAPAAKKKASGPRRTRKSTKAKAAPKPATPAPVPDVVNPGSTPDGGTD